MLALSSNTLFLLNRFSHSWFCSCSSLFLSFPPLLPLIYILELAEELAMTRDALSKLLDAHNGGRIEDVLAALKRGGGGGGGDGDGNDANRIDKKKQDSRGKRVGEA